MLTIQFYRCAVDGYSWGAKIQVKTGLETDTDIVYYMLKVCPDSNMPGFN